MSEVIEAPPRTSLTISARIDVPMPGDTYRSTYEKGSVIVLGDRHYLTVQDARVLQKALASAVAALDALEATDV